MYPHEPIHFFLTGGIETIIVFTLKLIIQGLLHLCNKELLANLENILALLIADTGKVTFHVNGTTIYSSLNALINQSLTNLSNISFGTLNRLTNKYEQLQFVAIDEISLVRIRMFNVVNQIYQLI